MRPAAQRSSRMFAATADAFVAQLQQELTTCASAVDRGFPENEELTIGADGVPTLKRLTKRALPPTAAAIETLITMRMPVRTVIDMLDTVARWTGCVRHFGPRSGNEPKLGDPLDRYVRLLFAYGTNLGPTQAALHMRGEVSAHSLGYLNRRHVTAATLHAAQADIISLYDRLPLTRRWGSGRSAAADGTKVEVADGNPLAEYHIRYQGMGVLAYRHVADTYIALFCQLIRCGVWEAVYLIEGLLGNQSDVQPKAVHTDTQGQSTPVFALTYLLGIELLPRIRNWKDMVFYKPVATITYTHIEALFSDTIDWALLTRHWQDLMQVVLSIAAGKVSSAAILRRLSTDSRRHWLYRAFRELGRVVRTRFLHDLAARRARLARRPAAAPQGAGDAIPGACAVGPRAGRAARPADHQRGARALAAAALVHPGQPAEITVLVGQALRDGIATDEHMWDLLDKLQAGEAAFEDEASEGRSKALGASLSYGFAHAFTERTSAGRWRCCTCSRNSWTWTRCARWATRRPTTACPKCAG